MSLTVYLPLLLTAAFGLTAPRLARRLPPATATWALSLGALITATGSAACLALLGFTLAAQVPALASRAHWSTTVLRTADPVAAPVAALALAVLAISLTTGARALAHRTLATTRAYRLSTTLPTSGGELAVLDTPEAQAFAVPGRPGRIVVTTGLLRGLDAAHRRALLAHERSHLTHRHHLHQSLVQVTAATSPCLRRLPAAMELACERWADEDAADVVRHRHTVAEALIRAAAVTAPNPGGVMLAAGGADVATRIDALAEPTPHLTVWRLALLTVLLTGVAAALANAMHDTERLFEQAQHAYLLTRH